MADYSPEMLTVSSIKRFNHKMQIMRLLYENKQSTASDLSKSLRLSLPTIRTILDALIESRMVSIIENDKPRRGRVPVVYEINTTELWVVSIEMGHYSAKLALVNAQNVLVSRIVEVATHIDDFELESKLFIAYQTILKELQSDGQNVIGLGVGMPGLIDSEKGINHTVKDKKYRDMASRFFNSFGQSPFIENDARMQALGELLMGKARQTKNALVVNWGWGVGLGMIMDGHVFSGSQGFAGEFSHIRMLSNGELCECGKTGCLQTIASLRHLIKLAQQAVRSNIASKLTESFRSAPENIQPDDVLAFAKKGDELCLSLLQRLSENLGWGLSILIQLYNPEMILLRGPLALAGQHVVRPLSLAIHKFSLNEFSNRLVLDVGGNNDHMGLYGVAAHVFQKKFTTYPIA